MFYRLLECATKNYRLNNISLITSYVDFYGMTLYEHKGNNPAFHIFNWSDQFKNTEKKKVGDLDLRCHYPKVLDIIWFYSLWMFLGKATSRVEETWKIRKVTNSMGALMTPFKCNDCTQGLWQAQQNGLFSTVTASYCFSGKWLGLWDD